MSNDTENSGVGPTGVIGQRIVDVRVMRDTELENENWGGEPEHRRPFVIEIEDGTLLFPASDPEGNRPGALFGVGDGGPFRFQPVN